MQQMSEQDQKAFKLYGKMPAKNALSKMQKVDTFPPPLLTSRTASTLTLATT